MQSMDWNNGFARKAGKYFIVIPHEVNEIGGNILNTITVEELAQNGTEGLQLIDVRPENDFSHGAIESAVNLPLEKIEAGETAILKKDQPVYLYCHVGENSRDAAEILEDDGFTTVNLEGGYRAWLRYQLTRVTMEDDSRKERTEQIEKSLIKKFRKPIWSRFTKALHDYEMIKDGDKIASVYFRWKRFHAFGKTVSGIIPTRKTQFWTCFFVHESGLQRGKLAYYSGKCKTS